MKMLNDAVREQENQSGGKSMRQKLRDKLSNPLDERQTSAAQ